ncbi:hypothetical protein [Marinobacterium mangrovicola]|uniref:Lipoprotein n=1 Tax=Marinobacterium mangrovicola TaxID=1476959 RepID=A0A4R1G923_9GAMM|nr:hypothetical protein [Marinobacterium mangrovicola]TCK04138.1 hypothetical protein CLV83_3553 [Marinobacterium mangrovicola]
MNNQWIKLFILSSALTALAGCSITPEGYSQDFARDLKTYGGNRYIKSPVVNDLEKQMIKIATAPDPAGPPYELQFNPRQLAILDSFNNRYDHRAMMNDINLVRAGFDKAVEAYYPEIGQEAACTITNKNGFFPNSNDEPNIFDWQFVRGSCLNGIAQGVGVARADQADAKFVGRFDRGVMIEGIFTMVRSDGRRVIQIGGVPNAGRNARLLTTELRKSGYQWHRYGDFDNKGHFQGFGINIWNYTDQMYVRSVGDFKNGNFDGLAAKQIKSEYASMPTYQVTLGTYSEGSREGISGFYNGFNFIRVGETKDDTWNGVGYEIYNNIDSFYTEYTVGRYVNGEEQGWFKIYYDDSFDKPVPIKYDEGVLVQWGDGSSNIDFGQVFALAAGTAIIGTADIDSISKIQIGSAFASDVVGGTNGQAMMNLQQNFDTEIGDRIRSDAAFQRSFTPATASTNANLPAGSSALGANSNMPDISQEQGEVEQASQVVTSGNQNRQQESTSTSTSTQVAARSASTSESTPANDIEMQTATTQSNRSVEQPPKENQYVGSGRDYPFTGTTDTFLKYEYAVDVAKTNLENQASKFCGSSMRTEIRWAQQPVCKESASAEGEYKCSIDAKVNCYENLCSEKFCGTAH